MKIMVILLAFFSLNAMAMPDAEVIIESNLMRSQSPIAETWFAADKELGRAWIVLRVKESKDTLGNLVERAESFTVSVDGLSYDPVSGNIFYENANHQKTVCAKKRRLLGFKKTRDCSINVAFDTRKVDDGFNLKKERVANITLDVARR